MHRWIAASSGLLDTRHAWIALAFWGVSVILFGIRRSLGAAPQDPIRPSGPLV